MIQSKSGHIKVDNTLNARLEIAREVMLPTLKTELFGSSTVMGKKIQL
jgi:vacuolar-type H+-ATPase subunit E/Vma4